MSWKVKSFDNWKCIGVVTDGKRELSFHSTSFQSDTSMRWPREGEEVEVVFNNSGELLSIHGK